MVSKKIKDILKKQHYKIIGNHSAVQICRWCKKDLTNEGECYKAKFYGINSYLCCQMSPSAVFCENRCIHCWRAIEHTESDDMKNPKNKIDNPKFIINESILAQIKLLSGFKGNKKINLKKFKEAQEPKHFAISLIGEPTLYPRIGELIEELRKLKKTSFLVTNGLSPEVLNELYEKDRLPTQLYLSLNAPEKKLYEKWHRSTKKNPWKKFNETLSLFQKLKEKTRTVIRMTLVKDYNMKDEMVDDYVKLIKRADPDFIEVKGFMSVGFARNRKGMGYDAMPRHKLIREYAERIAIGLNEDVLKSKHKDEYKILDEHVPSAVVLIGKDKRKMRIRDSKI